MTREEILAMKSELDEKVAEIIMGECYHQHWLGNVDSIYCRKCGESRFYHQHSQRYSTDISAWQVVEKGLISFRFDHYRDKNRWTFFSPDGSRLIDTDDFCEWVCKAALLAKLGGEHK